MNKTNLDKNDKHPRKGGHEKKITIFKGSQDNVQSHYRNDKVFLMILEC